MKIIPSQTWRPILVLLTMLLVSIPASTQDAARKQSSGSKEKARRETALGLPAAITQDPGDPASLDLYYGEGGKEHAPDPEGTFTFMDEDMNETSPKLDVMDSQGTVWKVKLGEESKPETAATRLLWAAGYFVDEDYYLPELKVQNLPRLHRGEQFVSADGIVRGARLKRKSHDVKKLGDWSWFNNPFIGTKELNGLRVMMSLINNWDLTTDNNSIYEVNGERRYLVSDVGASLGNTGNSIARSKSNVRDFDDSKFIDKERAETVDFVMHSRPLFLTAFDVFGYRNHTRRQSITKDIPRADAKWLGQRLGQLSESQINDCFRAAGYSPEESQEYTKVIERRIHALNAL